MATIRDHGGYCCGVRHIYGMDNTSVEQIDQLIREIDSIPNNGGSRDSGRLIEIILSSRQVGDRNPRGGAGRNWHPSVTDAGGWPAVLAARGFRLVSRFENKNSGADCYIFHRVPNFKSVRPADLPFAWTHEANPQRVLDAGGPGAAQVDRPAGGRFAVGDRFTYTGAGTPLFGLNGTVTRVRDEISGFRYDLRFDNGASRERYTSTYMQRIEGAPAVRVVATFYANFLQRTQARGGLFGTLELARAAAPNCQRRDKLEIMSDGTQRWTDNVRA